MIRVYNSDCLQVLKQLPDNSVDSIVTDPPYGIFFMKKQWDYDIPSVDIWKECLRVLKHGGYLLSFSSARTYHRIAVNIEDAGFDIKDQIMWIYSNGLPKSKHSLKPAHEPIVMAKKPMSENSISKNVAKWKTGGINVNESRLDKGRYPTNIMFDEKAARLLDEQTGILKSQLMTSGTKRKNKKGKTNVYSPMPVDFAKQNTYGDEGGASRFFYCGKASPKERNEGVERNTHPTVKPVKLMEYLLRLVTPKDGVVLDPFMGSGTTGKACIKLGLSFLGMEINKNFYETAKKRLEYELL